MTFGIESMRDYVLEFLDKELSRRTIEKAFAKICHVLMFFVSNFIVGNVGETRDMISYVPCFRCCSSGSFCGLEKRGAKQPLQQTREFAPRDRFDVPTLLRLISAIDEIAALGVGKRQPLFQRTKLIG